MGATRPPRDPGPSPALLRAGRRADLRRRLDLLDLLELVEDLRDDPPRYDLTTLGFDRGSEGLRPIKGR